MITRPARTTAAFFGVAGPAGVATAMVTSSVSLFLADDIGVSAWLLGLFFAVRAVAGIGVDLLVGTLSDRAGSRRALIAWCAVSSAIGSLGYVVLDDYWALMAAAVVFFSIGGATVSQLFAGAREHADTRGGSAARFTSGLRSAISLTWIFGPPLGLLIADRAGFGVLYGVTTALFLVTAAGALLLPRTPPPSARPPADPRGLDRRVVLLLVAMVLLFAANQTYQITIALFVTRDAGLTPAFAGVLLGTAAALEVPLMLYFGARADRFGKARLLLVAACVAAVFFTVVPSARSPLPLLVLQIPNAVWTSLALSLPLVMLQDRMPGRAGRASSLFSSSVRLGGLLGGATAGVAAGLLGTGRLFYACAALAVCAAAVLAVTRSASARTLPDRETEGAR